MIYVYVVVQFYPWFKFYFPLFKTHHHTLHYPKTKEYKIWTQDKIEPQHIKWTIRLKPSVTVFLIPSFRRSTVSSGNVRKIKKFFTFLNDAEDLWTIRLKPSVTVFLIPSFRWSTVSSGNVRKIKKFFTFLNDAEDLQKRGIKKRDTIAQGQLYIYTEMLKSV